MITGMIIIYTESLRKLALFDLRSCSRYYTGSFRTKL
jgi:hypothetical protein